MLAVTAPVASEVLAVLAALTEQSGVHRVAQVLAPAVLVVLVLVD